VQEAVVFEATPTEERVKGVHSPFPGNALGLDAVNVGCALLWALRILVLRELNVPGKKE